VMFTGADANQKKHKRCASARKASVKLPAISSSRRFAGESDMFEAFRSAREWEKVATLRAEQMLDDKHIHSSIRELKFKADQKGLSEALCHVQALRPSKSNALSGLHELKQQLKSNQRNVRNDRSEDKAEFALNSILPETQPLGKATKRSKSTLPQSPQHGDCDKTESNYLHLQRRFRDVQDQFGDAAVADEPCHGHQKLRPGIALPPLGSNSQYHGCTSAWQLLQQ
jgi:hypothetical protein